MQPFFGFVDGSNSGTKKEGGVLIQNSRIIKYSKKGRKLFIMEFTKIEMLKNILREVGKISYIKPPAINSNMYLKYQLQSSRQATSMSSIN